MRLFSVGYTRHPMVQLKIVRGETKMSEFVGECKTSVATLVERLTSHLLSLRDMMGRLSLPHMMLMRKCVDIQTIS